MASVPALAVARGRPSKSSNAVLELFAYVGEGKRLSISIAPLVHRMRNAESPTEREALEGKIYQELLRFLRRAPSPADL